MARKGSRRSVPNRPSLNNTKKPSAAKNEITHHLGLHLTVGALILIGAAWLFAIVSRVVGWCDIVPSWHHTLRHCGAWHGLADRLPWARPR